MPTYRAQVVFPLFTNLPRDVITNTFHFLDLSAVGMPAAAAGITPLLQAFYQSVYGGTHSLANYVKPDLAHVNWYDLSTPPPRVPLVDDMPFSPTLSATPIPTEVSAVVSFQGPPAAGIPQSRRRGRIYIGGLVTSMFVNSTTSAFPALNGTWVAGLGTAIKLNLITNMISGMRWVVHSQVDGADTIITNGWTDNTPDTQRRRGVEATSRTTWTT